MDQTPQNPQIPPISSDPVSPLAATLALLSRSQLRLVVYLMKHGGTKAAACKALDIPYETAKDWGPIIDQAVTLLLQEQLQGAREILRGALVEAAMVKIKGLESGDEKIRQNAATELIEWALGKATQPVNGSVTTAVKVYMDAEAMDAV